MRRPARMRETLPFYLIPIMIGLCGVLLSRQFTSSISRSFVVLMSVAASEFVMGHALGRSPSAGVRRFLLLFGAFMLAVGGVVATWDLASPDEFMGFSLVWSDVPEKIWELSRWIGILGLLLGLVVLFYTALRREEEVGELARQFSTLAEHMNEGFVFIDPVWLIKLANKSFLDMTGLTEAEILGDKGEEVARRLQLQSRFSGIERGGKGKVVEYRLAWNLKGREHEFWVSGTPIFDQRGQFAGTLATIRDITDLHEMSQRLERYTKGLQQLVEDRTQKLRESEEWLRGLLVHMNEGFMTVDSSHCILFANVRMRAILQVEPHQIVGRSLFDFIDSSGRAGLLAALHAADSRNRGQMQQELLLVRSDGGKAPVFAAVAPIEWAEGEGARYSIVTTDISDLKRMQLQLEERASELEAANEELRAMDRAKDGFLTTVSHELRTPLSTIRGYVEMFEGGSFGPVDPTHAYALKVIERNVDRLNSLIDDMIEFGRMQARGLEMSRSLFAFSGLLQECAHSVQPQLARRNLTLQTEIPEDFSPVWGDRKRIGQVVAILLSNAIKFSHEGNPVTIRVSQRAVCTLAVAVIDRGIGIDRVHHKRVFEKFFQVDSSLARRYEGAGIGLSIARSIAEAHGGLIELASEPQKGSTFTLVLPGALFESAAPSGAHGGLEPIRILLVDEQTESRAALAHSLTQRGCTVCFAQSVYEAVRLAQDSPLDVLLLTDSVQGVSFSAFLSRLREEPGTRDLSVIVLTGRAVSGAETVAIQKSGASLLVAPFSAEDLMERITRRRSGGRGQVPGLEDTARVDRWPSILVIDGDADLMEWMETSLRLRKIACYCDPDRTRAVDLVRAGLVNAVFVDVDIAGSGAADQVDAILEAAGDTTLPVYAMTGLPERRLDCRNYKAVFRKPFPIEDVVHAAISASATRAR